MKIYGTDKPMQNKKAFMWPPSLVLGNCQRWPYKGFFIVGNHDLAPLLDKFKTGLVTRQIGVEGEPNAKEQNDKT